MIKTLRITIVVEDATETNRPPTVIVQQRATHYVQDANLHNAKYPADMLQRDLEVALTHVAKKITPEVLKHIAPELAAKT